MKKMDVIALQTTSALQSSNLKLSIRMPRTNMATVHLFE